MNNLDKRRLPQPTLPPRDLRAQIRSKLDIYHPGYPGMKPLLSFNSSDHYNGTYGVDQGLVYASCTAITGNHWHTDMGRNTNVNRAHREDNDFYLSKTANGEPFPIPSHGVLPFDDYWWINPRDDRYPFCPNIDQYVMPSELPPPWQKALKSHQDEPESTHTNEADTARPSPAEIIINEGDAPASFDFPGEACRITGWPIGISLAHIIPKACSEWFNNSHMRRHASSTSTKNDPLNDMENRIAIRNDIHFLLDQSNLVLVPKEDRGDAGVPNGSYTMRIHVLNPPGLSRDGDLITLETYHNGKCYPLRRAPAQYVFARFVWSLMHDKMALLLTDENVKKVNFNLLLSEIGPDGKFRQIQRNVPGGVYRPRSGDKSTANQGKGRKRARSEEPEEQHDSKHQHSLLSDASSVASLSNSDTDSGYDDGPGASYKLFDKAIASLTRQSPEPTASDSSGGEESDLGEPMAKRAKQIFIPTHGKVERGRSNNPTPKPGIHMSSSFSGSISSEGSTHASNEWNFDKYRHDHSPAKQDIGNRQSTEKSWRAEKW
ncbi:hypothetical protein GGR53DRAFT_491050 [Hypoxylon sp. FL1150]|nr:hypothetical protein GGR53DRAFT_491050 [Hypoxylon sp. FL1150]